MSQKNINQLTIPREFYSDYENKPFSNCLMCNRDLLYSDVPYVIEKGYQIILSTGNKTTVFEHAVCMECSVKKKESLSEDSLQKMEMYFNLHFNPFERSREFAENNQLNIDDWIDSCAIHSKKKKDCQEYSTIALCKGAKLEPTILPYMMSDDAMEEINELISEKTRGEINRFIDDFYGFPPEYKELLKSKKLILI